MVVRFGGMDLSLEGGEVDEGVEDVAKFWYLGRPLYQMDNDCSTM